MRLQLFPGLEHQAAAAELGEWARANGIAVAFDQRLISAGRVHHHVIYVLFTAS